MILSISILVLLLIITITITAIMMTTRMHKACLVRRHQVHLTQVSTLQTGLFRASWLWRFNFDL